MIKPLIIAVVTAAVSVLIGNRLVEKFVEMISDPYPEDGLK